jgi:hypothetical protein
MLSLLGGLLQLYVAYFRNNIGFGREKVMVVRPSLIDPASLKPSLDWLDCRVHYKLILHCQLEIQVVP